MGFGLRVEGCRCSIFGQCKLNEGLLVVYIVALVQCSIPVVGASIHYEHYFMARSDP